MTAGDPGRDRDPLQQPAGAEAPLDDIEAGDVVLDTADVADEIGVRTASIASSPIGRWSGQTGKLARTSLALVSFFFLAAIIWETLKWFGGTPWRFEDILGTGLDYFHDPPFRVLQLSDRQLPHTWAILSELFEPFRRGSDVTMLEFLLDAAAFTMFQALIGFFLGVGIGILLASIFVHWISSERAFMPYVVASQTIPIVALAPVIAIVVGLGVTEYEVGGFVIPVSFAVVVVTTYLTFFPVTISQLRGLRSPDPRAMELMRSYGASRWAVYRKLRMPASVPFLFTALKIAATWAIIGAIIGEGPGGVGDGLGKAIITFNQQYITGPEKLWATILIAAFVGVAAFLAVRIVEVIVLRNRPGGAT